MHTSPSGSENIAATRFASVATRSLPAMMYGHDEEVGNRRGDPAALARRGERIVDNAARCSARGDQQVRCSAVARERHPRIHQWI